MIIHTSDWHIGKRCAAQAAEYLTRGIIGTHDPDADTIVISGDLVDSPEASYYRRAATYITRLINAGFVVVAVPGNHDVWRSGVDVGLLGANYALWRKHIGSLVGGVEIGAGVVEWRSRCGRQILGLDTNAGCTDDLAPDLAAGCVGARQLMIITSMMEIGAVVVGHHRTDWPDLAHRLKDGAQLEEILTPRAVAYLCGHQHVKQLQIKRSTIFAAAPRSTELKSHAYHYGALDLEATQYQWLQLDDYRRSDRR